MSAPHMLSTINPFVIMLSAAFGLFLGMLLFYEIGRKVGLRTLQRDSEGLPKGVQAAEGTVFALLGLIIAFTFSGAGARFEARRALITEEANNIGTAYLRLDLLPADAQPPLRDLFRRYTDLRARPPKVETTTSADAWYAASDQFVQDLWSQTLAASRRPDADKDATKLLVPALNSMIDIASTRERATRDHPPLAIYLLLGGLSLVGALLVGYAVAGNARRTWLHPVAFAAIMALSVYLILDMEFPRIGLIQVTDADQALVDARKDMR